MTPNQASELKLIKKEVDYYLNQLGITDWPKVYYGPTGSNRYQVHHVLYEGNEWQYVYYERGLETMLAKSSNMDEVVYAIIKPIAATVAAEFCRKPNVIQISNHRECRFNRQTQELSKLRADWGEKWQRELKSILESHPYKDT